MTPTRRLYLLALGAADIYLGSRLIGYVAQTDERRRQHRLMIGQAEVTARISNDVAGALDRSAGVEHRYVGDTHVCLLCLTPRAHPLHAPDLERVHLVEVEDAEVVDREGEHGPA